MVAGHEGAAPVLVPGHHDEAVRIVAREEGGEELTLAAAPDDLNRVWEAAVAPLAHIRHLLRSACNPKSVDEHHYTRCLDG